MALAAVSSCGVFSAISGSSLATAASMARVALPEMRKAMGMLDLLVVVDPYPTMTAVLQDRQDGVYVLQMNADALDGQEGPLMDATSIIDDKTTITP